MNESKALAEALALKAMLVGLWNKNTLAVDVQDVMERVNAIIDAMQEGSK